MGMFDNIICKYPLPQPSDLKEMATVGLQHLNYQTKDLNCGLTQFTIREDGTLWETRQTYDVKSGNPNAPDIISKLPEITVVNTEEIQVNQHGSIWFCDFYPCSVDHNLNNNYFIEYHAKFTHGKLELLELVRFDVTDASERKSRDLAQKAETKRYAEFQAKWYVKYGYAYYVKFIRSSFRLYRQLSSKLPSSHKVENRLLPY